MKKIFLLFVLTLFSSNSAHAQEVATNKCELKNIIGKKYSDLKDEYNIKYEFDYTALPASFELQTRGNKLCDKLDGKTEVTAFFIDGIAAQLTFNNYSSDSSLQTILEKNFGVDIVKNAANKYGNIEMQRWEFDDVVVAYSKTNEVKQKSENTHTPESNGWPKEILNITSRSLSSKLTEVSASAETSTKEQKE